MSERMVRRTAEAIATLGNGRVHAAKLHYTWDPSDPLVMRVIIEVAMNSVPVNEEEFPEGLRCERCRGVIPNGSCAVPVAESNMIDALWCTSCGYGRTDAQRQQELWEVSAEMVAAAVDDKVGNGHDIHGQVSVVRINDVDLRYTFREGVNVMYVASPVNPMIAMFREIRLIARTQPTGNVASTYLNKGLEMLENLANRGVQ